MAKTMLIDAAQSEETRVAVLDGNGRLEEFDLDITSKLQIKGDIYLAKVTRVEPSLQAAFVNYGGNRHGFLPFSEIHPDYYKIPVADREALQAEIEEILAQRAENEEADEDEVEEVVAEVIAELEASEGLPPAAEDLVDEEGEEKPKKKRAPRKTKAKKADEDAETSEETSDEEAEEKPKKKTVRKTKAKTAKAMANKTEELVDNAGEEGDEKPKKKRAPRRKKKDDDSASEDRDESDAESKNDEDADQKKSRGGRRGNRYRRSSGGRYSNNKRHSGRRRSRDDDDGKSDVQSLIFKRLHRRYKIQEVIKRGQIVLVQATKEERGNKGAAMTTYMSLPGRYSVLMPNSPRSGGVSRKIFDRKERDRLKKIFAKLEIPEGMSAILRTAGVGQSATDIKRDYQALQDTWGKIREKTLSSTAPAIIHQEGSVIKRAIRDIYSEEIGDVYISGEDALNETKEFMKTFAPGQLKTVKQHKAADPLFVHHKAEEQIAAIDNHTITLKSGGYLVFSPTEALVAIDINSGRSTRERHIEETALNTNLEAAEEIARQMRLRDLGGLIVIDFIDMEDHRHNILVERKLESAIARDRARIQMSRISQFGLMELSRQRLRPSLTESHFITCPTCDGQGMVRTTESAAIVILRAIAQEGANGKGGVMAIRLPEAVCLYLLNNKRANVTSLEQRYDTRVELTIDPSLGESQYVLERQKDNGQSAEAAADNSDDGDADQKHSKKKPSKRRRNSKKSDDYDAKKDNDVTEASSDVSEDPAEEEKPVKKTAKKAAPKKPSSDKKDDDKKSVKDMSEDKADVEKPSKEEKKDNAPAHDPGYEVITEVKEKPKKGWWRKVVN